MVMNMALCLPRYLVIDNMIINLRRIFLLITTISITLGALLLWKEIDHFEKLNSYQQSQTLITLSPTPSSSNIAGIGVEEVLVTRVIDGDTIEVQTGMDVLTVRYIGIDTPETVNPRRPVQCFGRQASNENKKLVEGKKVILSKDVSETDKYGRLLRFVYVKLENGELLFVNDYLIRQGFAKASTFPPDVKYAQSFLEAEREARENRIGLWNSCY